MRRWTVKHHSTKHKQPNAGQLIQIYININVSIFLLNSHFWGVGSCCMHATSQPDKPQTQLSTKPVYVIRKKLSCIFNPKVGGAKKRVKARLVHTWSSKMHPKWEPQSERCGLENDEKWQEMIQTRTQNSWVKMVLEIKHFFEFHVLMKWNCSYVGAVRPPLLKPVKVWIS